MRQQKRRQKFLLSLFVIFSVFINCLPVARAQDVVTSDDFTGGSSAFVFKASRKAAQSKVAFIQPVRRTQSQQAETSKRVIRQAITVARVSPKRTRSKEVNPNTLAVNTIELKRKSPAEAAVIFAGVGEYFLREEDVDEALEYFREAVTLDAANVNAKNGLSEALTRKGDQLLSAQRQKLAMPLYEEALEYNAKNAGAYAGMAEIYIAREDKVNAIASYKKALELDPELTELLAPLGVLYFQEGLIAEAEDYLQRAVLSSPDNAETQFFFGLLRYKQNRNEEAVKAFRRSVELDPNTAQVYYYLGEALDRLDHPNESIKAYQRAVELNPRYIEAWFDLGVAYYNRERYLDAVTAYKEVAKLKANHGEARANLADVYRQLSTLSKDPKEVENYLTLAISEYRLATTFIKDDPDIYRKFGFVAGRVAVYPGYEDYWNLAIENLEKARALSNDQIDYVNLGWAHYNAARADLKLQRHAQGKARLLEAKRVLEAAVRLNDREAAPYLNLGMTLTDLGEYRAAVEALNKALEIRKNWIPAINELGLAYRQSRDYENAVRQFRRAIELDDNYAVAHYNLAETQYQRGNLAEAKKGYRKLKELNRLELVLELERATRNAVSR